MLKSYLQLFRVVNLPTVPGDVLVGAAVAALAGSGLKSLAAAPSPLAVAGAAVASVCLYLFGLADNDIIGAATDSGRPIPRGEISLRAAMVARGLCLFAAPLVGAAVNLPSAWWFVALALVLAIVIYNRTKWPLTMGLCRGFNVLAGAAALGGGFIRFPVLVAALVWTALVAALTHYSRGEELDPAKRRLVGMLVGGIVYLQLAALLMFPVRPFLIAGALLLLVLRLLKRLLPEVSAS